jgi:hypothetical protein
MGRATATAADVMFNEPQGSFRAWLLEQKRRRDVVGDLARDLLADRCLGQAVSPVAIHWHLQAAHFPCDCALGALRVAVDEWNVGR